MLLRSLARSLTDGQTLASWLVEGARVETIDHESEVTFLLPLPLPVPCPPLPPFPSLSPVETIDHESEVILTLIFTHWQHCEPAVLAAMLARKSSLDLIPQVRVRARVNDER